MNGFRIGIAAVVMLVLLRISIGWHFLYEGVWKQQNPGFSAEGFLRQARGPWQEHFRALVPDPDGKDRLDAKALSDNWDTYRRDLVDYYNLSDEQQEAQGKIYGRYDQQLQEYVVQNQAEITKYQEGLTALEAAKQDPSADDMPFAQKRRAEREAALRAQAAPWLAYIDTLDRNYKAELLTVLDKDQRIKGKPSEPVTTLAKIDKMTTYGLIAIGVGLMVGLFTRLSSLAGAAFLLLVVLAQPAYPGVFPVPHPSAGHSLFVNKELIEMIALLALAATPVGRWAGLDFVIHYLFVRPVFGKRKET